MWKKNGSPNLCLKKIGSFFFFGFNVFLVSFCCPFSNQSIPSSLGWIEMKVISQIVTL